jgi:CMP-N-acetylneuraminate monooxygenase
MNAFELFVQEKIKYEPSVLKVEININEINQGITQDENFIFSRNGQEITIFDRICDHNGGRLSLKGVQAVCHLHNWKLDVQTATYTNVRCKKAPILVANEHELDSPLVDISVEKEQLTLVSYKDKKSVDVTFLNHACLHFNIENKFSFATDPWVIGSAFSNGWWLSKGSPSDVFEQLNSCNFIYISHNHPDHLHPQSLSHIRKDMPILTAAFDSESTVSALKECGFSNIIAMDFSSRLSNHVDEISFTVLKSGDFRDDSGLLIEIGEFKCLLTVDTNSLNFGKLPSNVDLLCSSFAGGASGFPLCFQNNSEDEKRKVIARNRSAIKETNRKNIQVTSPKYFMPYAGFFTEKAIRDSYVKERNIKNAIEDYQEMCSTNSCNLLNVNVYQLFRFEGSSLACKSLTNANVIEDLSVEQYLSQVDVADDEDLRSAAHSYFVRSRFTDNLILDLIFTNDSFDLDLLRLVVDFSSNPPFVCNVDESRDQLEIRCLAEDKRYLQIRVRRDELHEVITNGKPWEDLSIGFQCRIYRNPDIYNSEFWYHFTNNYTGLRVNL